MRDGIDAMTAENAVFEERVAGEPTRLAGSRCTTCGRVQFPRIGHCPACTVPTEDLSMSGPARLVFATQVEAQPPDSLVEAPYAVGVAEFAEGLRIIGLLEDPAASVGEMVVPVVYRPTDALVTFAFRRMDRPT